MATEIPVCNGCRENLPSQRDHSCAVGGAASEVLHLFRLSPETIRKERALRDPPPSPPRTSTPREGSPYCAGCKEEQPSITDHTCMGF